ncbi:MAG TPA: hypothetical protein VKF41_09025 [Bryobacteraceae bacterium]|nr:hypothetical protein [Bryobacteraceae bacterium]
MHARVVGCAGFGRAQGLRERLAGFLAPSLQRQRPCLVSVVGSGDASVRPPFGVFDGLAGVIQRLAGLYAPHQPHLRQPILRVPGDIARFDGGMEALLGFRVPAKIQEGVAQ